MVCNRSDQSQCLFQRQSSNMQNEGELMRKRSLKSFCSSQVKVGQSQCLLQFHISLAKCRSPGTKLNTNFVNFLQTKFQASSCNYTKTFQYFTDGGEKFSSSCCSKCRDIRIPYQVQPKYDQLSVKHAICIKSRTVRSIGFCCQASYVQGEIQFGHQVISCKFHRDFQLRVLKHPIKQILNENCASTKSFQ